MFEAQYKFEMKIECDGTYQPWMNFLIHSNSQVE